MLRHIGLVAVAVALVTLTAETVHGRGGMRGHSSFRYNFGSGGYSFGNYYPGGTGTVSSHYRGSFGTSRSSRKSSNSAGNSLSSEADFFDFDGSNCQYYYQTRRNAGCRQQHVDDPTNDDADDTRHFQSGVLVNADPSRWSRARRWGLCRTLGIPLTQDPNTAAERTYRGLLHNAKELIRAGVYPAAINDLQRIINGAPGTRIAAEAQRLLARIPTN